jgi:D-arabinose 1-dehydrogenase-like Zn-dependent alcohol dehydrogenase
LIERDIPEPGAGQVRVKAEACGICHSDALVKEGLWPGLQYPRAPGHEVAGPIDAVGDNVIGWTIGQVHRCRPAWRALLRVRAMLRPVRVTWFGILGRARSMRS